MHGIMFHEMKKFVVKNLGADAWDTLLVEAGLQDKSYMATGQYPDEEVVALVKTAAKITNKPAAKILEDFGLFIVPDLAKVYGSLINPNWKTLDLLEHVEHVIHKVIRGKDPDAKPPRLICNRISPNEIQITYSSARKMCYVAKGIISGVAALYGEKVTVTETACMHKGNTSCIITVTLAK